VQMFKCLSVSLDNINEVLGMTEEDFTAGRLVCKPDRSRGWFTDVRFFISCIHLHNILLHLQKDDKDIFEFFAETGSQLCKFLKNKEASVRKEIEEHKKKVEAASKPPREKPSASQPPPREKPNASQPPPQPTPSSQKSFGGHIRRDIFDLPNPTPPTPPSPLATPSQIFTAGGHTLKIIYYIYIIVFVNTLIIHRYLSWKTRWGHICTIHSTCTYYHYNHHHHRTI